MIIQFQNNEITFDGTPIIRDLRMNVQDRGTRITCSVSDKHNVFRDVDMVLYNLTMKLVKITSYHISFRGLEKKTGKEFKLSLVYELTRGALSVQLDMGAMKITRPIKNIADVIKIVEMF